MEVWVVYFNPHDNAEIAGVYLSATEAAGVVEHLNALSAEELFCMVPVVVGAVPSPPHTWSAADYERFSWCRPEDGDSP